MKPLVRLWYSHAYRINFLGIPKTGSTTIRRLLDIEDNSCWHYIDEGITFPYQIFTVVRDPYERFLSSYHETLRRRTHDGTIDELLKELENGIFKDEHTLPQADYLEEAQKYGVFSDYYLICDNSLTRQLNTLLTTDFRDIRLNETIGKGKLENGQRRIIEEIYWKDFMIYESIKASASV